MAECRYCQKQIDADNAILLFGRHYVCSEECKKQYETTDMYYKAKMLDYVWNLCDKNGDFVELKSQAEYYHDAYKFKYSGMLKTVQYWVEIEGNIWKNKWGLGQIFPTAYDRALQYWKEENKAKKYKTNICPPKERTISVGDDTYNKLAERFKVNIEEL